jgi:hypothetical protein
VNESGLLDELVAPFDGEPDDWDDVLRRARRPHLRRRLVLAFAGAAAVGAVASAVALPLLRSDPSRLPAAADRRNVHVVVQPHTGRVLIEAAAWKGHHGVCYVIVGRSSGCTPRAARLTMIAHAKGHAQSYAVWGITFDKRVASAKVMFGRGQPRSVPIHRVGGSVRATFVGPISVPLGSKDPVQIRFYDAAGRLITQR